MAKIDLSKNPAAPLSGILQRRINLHFVPTSWLRGLWVSSPRELRLDFRSIFSTILGLEVIKMNITSDIKSVTYLKAKAADLLNQINETHRPVIITQNGEPRAVLQDPKSYENMRNAIGILKLVSQGESDIKNGRAKSQEDVFRGIENSLKEKLK
jgi:prevent-host-death family protein